MFSNNTNFVMFCKVSISSPKFCNEFRENIRVWGLESNGALSSKSTLKPINPYHQQVVG